MVSTDSRWLTPGRALPSCPAMVTAVGAGLLAFAVTSCSSPAPSVGATATAPSPGSQTSATSPSSVGSSTATTGGQSSQPRPVTSTLPVATLTPDVHHPGDPGNAPVTVAPVTVPDNVRIGATAAAAGWNKALAGALATPTQPHPELGTYASERVLSGAQAQLLQLETEGRAVQGMPTIVSTTVIKYTAAPTPATIILAVCRDTRAVHVVGGPTATAPYVGNTLVLWELVSSGTGWKIRDEGFPNNPRC